jgi:LysM repeat protein
MENQEENNFDKVVESPVKPLTMKTTFIVVIGIHVAAIAGIAFFSSIKKANAEDKKFLAEEPVYVGVDNPTPSPTPEAIPSPTPEIVKHEQPWPKATPELKTYPNTKKAIPVVKEKVSRYTKEYVIQSGDTFHSIVRKYKLNPERLKKLNNITNENKIQAGQKLKLM